AKFLPSVVGFAYDLLRYECYLGNIGFNRWRQSQEGEGQVVVFSGEAGVGKSRIVEEFRSQLEDNTYGLIALSCSPFHTNSALYPVIDCLIRVMEFRRDDPIATRADKLDAFIENLELPLADIAPYLAPVLLETDLDRYAVPQGSPEEHRNKVSEALLALMLAQSRLLPMIMIVEDAQWLDPSSEEFLGLLIERLRSLRIFLLVTARPEFQPRWGSHPHLTTLTLNRLSRSDSSALVQNVTGGRDLPEAVLEQIGTKTDGIPLFVEELTKTVLETGLVEERDGRYQLVGPLNELAIPASLQDSLMARLDRLAQVKDVAQLAAVLGRRFSQSVLAAVSQLGSDELEAALNQLVEAEVLFQSSLPPAASYEFKHGMVQETAYGSLLKSTRQRYHRDVAEALEADFPETATDEPELLAHHYSEAGLAEAAVPCWRRASRRATERWASAESVGHVERGLELLDTLPDNAARAEQEMPLLLDLVAGLRILDRYDEALAALDRAQTVAERYQRIEDLSQVHYFRGSIYFPMGDIEGCLAEHELARENARLADSPEKEARALSGLGDAYYMRGRMAASHRHFDECVELARAHELAAIEPPNLAMRGHTQLYLNQLEAGRADTLKAAELAQQQGNERAEMVARGSCAGKLLFDTGELDQARQSCQRAIDLARGLGARCFDPVNQVIIAKVALIEGRRDEAIALAEEAVATTRETGPRFAGPMALGTLALVSDSEEVRRQAISEGLAILDSECVSHNYLWFYRDAMEACLLAGNFDGVEALAQAAADYTSSEPLPWMDLLIARARTLAQAATAPDEGTQSRLRELRDQAAEVGFNVLLPSFDVAMAD
ncbi:MAG: AAA family ATPase, partial [Alphaproteobacteria bacterium]|nr:AAA family ATPase [Alphaproteobacteria bacterium]